MKVALVTADGMPADGRLRRHARVLAAAGHRVTCYGVLGDGDEPEEDDGDVVLVRVPADRFEAPRGALGALGARRAFRRIEPVVASALTRDPPEAIHAMGLEVAVTASAAAARAGIPFLFDEPGTGALPLTPEREERLPPAARKLHRRATGELADVLSRPLAGAVAGSETIAAAMRRHLPDRPVVVRDLPPWSAPERGNALRVRLGLWPTERVLVHDAPLSEPYGFEDAVRSLVHAEGGSVLAIVGGSWCEDRVRSVAESCGVADRVRTLPRPQPAERRRWLGAADAVVLAVDPGSEEAAALLPETVSAIHAGTPIVVPAGTEVSRLVTSLGCGVVAESRAPQDLAAAWGKILRDERFASRLSDACLVAAREELSWEREQLRLVDLYDRL